MSELFERKNIGTFEFNLVRQSRKSPSIMRDSKDIIWVYVNYDFTDSEVELFVQRSSVQIAKLMEPNIKLSFDQQEIVDREEFLFLGDSYQLRIVNTVNNDFEFDGRNFLMSHHSTQKGKELFKEFYTRRAKELISLEKVHFENIIGKVPKEIVLCELSDKWGVCTPTGIIKINWRAVMLPKKLFNYVLAHEYAHLIHLNHTSSFWRCLDSLIENSRHLDRELEKYIFN